MFTIRCILRHSNTLSICKLQNRTKRGSGIPSVLKPGVRFFFKTHLVITNGVTSGLFMGFGDMIQQEIEFQYKIIQKRYDWPRILRMCTVGCFLGPLHHYYYMYLDKILPGATIRVVIQKILADQFFASPATIICFFYGMDYLEGKTLEQTKDEIFTKFKYVYLGDWCFWPPVQFLNFYYLPTQYRVIYINFVTMIFNIFLSYIKHYDQH